MFICTNCDGQSPKWAGRCPVCDKWGTLVEETVEPRLKPGATAGKAKAAQSRALKDVVKQNELDRLTTGDAEIDRVLGGGIVRGSVVLLSGEPGIGKSTMVALIAGRINSTTQRLNHSITPVLYISGEESPTQLASRFDRLGLNTDCIRFLEPYPVETLVATIEKETPVLAVIDSVQTLSSSSIESTAGSPTLVRYATSLLLDLAKRTGVSILLVGQVTKDGSIAGPKTLEHLVDVVLNLEGDPIHAYRMLRAAKNRFGATDEIGVFEMTQKGLEAVANPSQRFLSERAQVPGSVITATVEGSRVFFVEVQALVENSAYGMPVRRASGMDQNRLQMLIAIASKRGGLKLADKDVYVNVIGGMELKEPATDLAVCAAIASAINNRVEASTMYVGEVGLGGEVRTIPLVEKRVSEAVKLGISKAVVPSKSKLTASGIEVQKIDSIHSLN
jgi:DNA repair protein RadA/Sms